MERARDYNAQRTLGVSMQVGDIVRHFLTEQIGIVLTVVVARPRFNNGAVHGLRRANHFLDRVLKSGVMKKVWIS